MIFPAKHFVVGQDKMDVALSKIRQELDDRLLELNSMGKLLEAQRLEQRTRFDIEMLQAPYGKTGTRHTIERGNGAHGQGNYLPPRERCLPFLLPYRVALF